MAEELQKGDIVAGKLEVIRKIGGGGMGAVYEVEHQLTRHRRALKVLHKSQSLNRRYVERLLREASVAGRLNTPHVVETLDAGMLEDGTPYLLMELLDGTALLDVIEREAPLDVTRTVRIIRQVCEGMAAAHAAGIVHRDLKPENIIVKAGPGGRDEVKIIDFGISRFSEPSDGGPVSRLTSEGTIIGTPYYMSPEQASGLDVDGRTDVYALGVILYEALTGRLPFIAETTGALFIKIGTGEYLPLKHRRRDVDPELAEIVERAFHRKPEERFASAEELSDALAPYAKDVTSGGTPRRATADYESDPPRPRTSPGVAPMAPGYAETVEFDDAVPLQKSFAARGRVAAPVIPVGTAFPRPNSRDLPTEELEAPPSVDAGWGEGEAALRGDVASGAAPSGDRSRAGDGRADQARSVSDGHPEPGNSGRPPDGAALADRASPSDHPSDAASLAPRRLPPWVGTTSLAALVAALVAAAILVVARGGDGPSSAPPDVTGPAVDIGQPPPEPAPSDRPPEEDPPSDPVATPEAPDPVTPNDGPGTPAATMDGAGDEGRPRMIRATMMSPSMSPPSMQSAADEAGLLPDPYAP